MDAKGLAEFGDQRWRQPADLFAYLFGCYRADLFRLCFSVVRQARLAGWKQHLEGVDASRIGGHRYDCHDSAPETGCSGSGGIVADDNRRLGLAGFRSAGRVEAGSNDLPAAHSVLRCLRPDGHAGR